MAGDGVYIPVEVIDEFSRVLRSFESHMKRSMTQGGREMDKAGKKAVTAKAKFKAFFSEVERRTGISGQKLAQWGRRAALALTGFATAGVAAANQFSERMGNVATILGDTSQIEGYKKAILGMAKDGLGSATDLANALYQTISAGVTKPADALQFLEKAAKGAKIGLASSLEAVDLGTTVLNAFGYEASEAGRVFDEIQVAIREGKTTFAQLAASVGQAAPAFATAELSSGELFAALATLTKGGIDTANAATYLKNTVLQIINPAKDAAKVMDKLGIQYGAAAFKSKGLAGVLAEIKEKTKGNADALVKIVPNIRAFMAVASLAGEQSAEFARIQGEVNNALGEQAKRWKDVRERADFALSQLKDSLHAALIEGFTPALEAMAKWLQQGDNLKNLTKAFQDFANTVAGALKWIIENLGAVESALKAIVAGWVFTKLAGVSAALKAVGMAAGAAAAGVNLLKIAFAAWLGWEIGSAIQRSIVQPMIDAEYQAKILKAKMGGLGDEVAEIASTWEASWGKAKLAGAIDTVTKAMSEHWKEVRKAREEYERAQKQQAVTPWLTQEAKTNLETLERKYGTLRKLLENLREAYKKAGVVIEDVNEGAVEGAEAHAKAVVTLDEKYRKKLIPMLQELHDLMFKRDWSWGGALESLQKVFDGLSGTGMFGGTTFWADELGNYLTVDLPQKVAQAWNSIVGPEMRAAAQQALDEMNKAERLEAYRQSIKDAFVGGMQGALQNLGSFWDALRVGFTQAASKGLEIALGDWGDSLWGGIVSSIGGGAIGSLFGSLFGGSNKPKIDPKQYALDYNELFAGYTEELKKYLDTGQAIAEETLRQIEQSWQFHSDKWIDYQDDLVTAISEQESVIADAVQQYHEYGEAIMDSKRAISDLRWTLAFDLPEAMRAAKKALRELARAGELTYTRPGGTELTGKQSYKTVMRQIQGLEHTKWGSLKAKDVKELLSKVEGEGAREAVLAMIQVAEQKEQLKQQILNQKENIKELRKARQAIQHNLPLMRDRLNRMIEVLKDIRAYAKAGTYGTNKGGGGGDDRGGDDPIIAASGWTGVVTGPQSGYPAPFTLHGPERVQITPAGQPSAPTVVIQNLSVQATSPAEFMGWLQAGGRAELAKQIAEAIKDGQTDFQPDVLRS